jgi:hypothetical protein
MSETIILALYISLIICALLLLIAYRISNYTFDNVTNVYEIASKDLGSLGVYDVRLRVSVKYWIYAIETRVYQHDTKVNLIDTLRTWNKEYNKDPAGFISDGIEAAHSDFLSELDKAREENRKPSFKVSADYDYHDLPSTFNYNDHIAANVLIDQIDMLLGGI